MTKIRLLWWWSWSPNSTPFDFLISTALVISLSIYTHYVVGGNVLGFTVRDFVSLLLRLWMDEFVEEGVWYNIEFVTVSRFPTWWEALISGKWSYIFQKARLSHNILGKIFFCFTYMTQLFFKWNLNEPFLSKLK